MNEIESLRAEVGVLREALQAAKAEATERAALGEEFNRVRAELREARRERDALRDALKALIAAVDDDEFDGFFTARAAAAAVLGTGANLGDSGMGEAGGVSDGPQ